MTEAQLTKELKGRQIAMEYDGCIFMLKLLICRIEKTDMDAAMQLTGVLDKLSWRRAAIADAERGAARRRA